MTDPKPASQAPRIRALRRALLTWYRRHRRDLPWRRTRDPYAIWISETMLQQTRVETVIPYFQRFLERFPTVSALADAPADDVMRHWAGLGYYTRARNLHAAAKTIAQEMGGELPDEVDGLRKLRGVGPYTAGAVASIAFDRPAAVVDGNVARVLARIHDLREDVRKPEVQARLWDEALALAAGRSPGDLNQALMELGALLCTPRNPSCPACPVRAHCRGLEAGEVEKLPVKSKAPKPKRIEGVAVWMERGGRVLAVRRPPEGLLGGLWELPGGDLLPRESREEGLARLVRERLGLEIKNPERLGSVKHSFTHRVLRLHVFRADLGAGRVRRSHFDAHRWCSTKALCALPVSAVADKALAVALDAD